MKSVNTFLCSCGRRAGLSGYRAAGSTCGISPSWSLQDSRTAAGRASRTQTRSTPAGEEEMSWCTDAPGFAKWKLVKAEDMKKRLKEAVWSKVFTEI